MSSLSVGLSHVILAGLGGYCLFVIKDQPLDFPHATFGIICLHNILAAWSNIMEYGIDSYSDMTFYAQMLFSMPCITTKVWLDNGYQKEMCWAWAAVPIIPMLSYISGSFYYDTRMSDLIILLNVVGLGAVSYKAKNYYGMGAAGSQFMAHFCIRRWREIMYNLTLCVFTYCALQTIGAAHKGKWF